MLLKKIFNVVGLLRNIYLCRSNPSEYAKKLGVKLGDNVRIIGLNRSGKIFGSEPYLIEIGDHVTITEGVRFITHDGGVWVFRENNKGCNIFGRIIVGNNVFFGIRAIIMPGVCIGNNVVVGAGSVVTKSVPDNTVVAGVPAKMIKTYDEYYLSCEGKLDETVFSSNKSKKEYLINRYL